MNKTIKNFFCGALIGASILVPGLSGGTTALLLGIYGKIMNAIGNLFHDIKKNILFLFTLSLGAVLGFFLCSFPINYIMLHYSFEASFVIMGLLLGSTPVFLRSASEKPVRNTLLVIIGFLITTLFDEIVSKNAFEKGGLAIVTVIALLSAAALILPGISLTYVLLAFNYYEKLLIALTEFDILFLMQFFCTVLVFVILLSKLLDRGYKKYPVTVNMTILGMLLASVKQSYITMPLKGEALICILLFIFGVCIVPLICLFEKRADRVQ